MSSKNNTTTWLQNWRNLPINFRFPIDPSDTSFLISSSKLPHAQESCEITKLLIKRTILSWSLFLSLFLFLRRHANFSNNSRFTRHGSKASCAILFFDVSWVIWIFKGAIFLGRRNDKERIKNEYCVSEQGLVFCQHPVDTEFNFLSPGLSLFHSSRRLYLIAFSPSEIFANL